MLNEAAGQPCAQEASVQVLALVEERQQARTNQDWERSDELRQQISDLGWTVKDTPGGPQLELRSGDL
jgi:cysteinyl-tRNA synthetase